MLQFLIETIHLTRTSAIFVYGCISLILAVVYAPDETNAWSSDDYYSSSSNYYSSYYSSYSDDYDDSYAAYGHGYGAGGEIAGYVIAGLCICGCICAGCYKLGNSFICGSDAHENRKVAHWVSIFLFFAMDIWTIAVAASYTDSGVSSIYYMISIC